MVSSVLVTVCLAMVGSAFLLDWSSMLTLVWLCMFMFTFSLGLGPVTFVVASEVGGKTRVFVPGVMCVVS